MKLDSMSLEHFRCFDSLKVDFDPQLTVFVGVNGSGKTALLDAAALLLKRMIRIMFRYSNGSDINTIRNGYLSSSIDYTISLLQDDEKYTFSLTYAKENDEVESKASDNGLLVFKNELKNTKKHIFVFYTAGRSLANAERQKEPRTEQRYAFVKAFTPQIDFSNTLTWFIDKVSQEAIEARNMKNMEHRLPDLSAVRMAVAKALGEYNEPYAGDMPLKLFITRKDAPDRPLTLEQLSDGYRTMLALVMDLARRMAVANAHAVWEKGESVLHSPGIVLIDEVELHLHPSWQQTVLPTLMEIFPNVQFIVTTHSPQVISSLEAKHVRILDKDNVYTAPRGTWGAEASRILKQIFNVERRPPSRATDELREYEKLVHADHWNSPRARELHRILAERYGDQEPELLELQLYIENRQWELEEEAKEEKA